MRRLLFICLWFGRTDGQSDCSTVDSGCAPTIGASKVYSSGSLKLLVEYTIDIITIVGRIPTTRDLQLLGRDPLVGRERKPFNPMN